MLFYMSIFLMFQEHRIYVHVISNPIHVTLKGMDGQERIRL